MKLDRLIWGILLLFIGGVLLLENFGIINFYWRNVWGFWPIFLIIGGLNILFNRNNSQTGSIISIAVLVVALSFLFIRGQQIPERGSWWGSHFKKGVEIDIDDNDEDNDNDGDTSSVREFKLSEPFVSTDNAKKTILNIAGGGISFNLNGETSELIDANVKGKNGNFSLKKAVTDSATILTFQLDDKRKKWNFNNGSNDVDFHLNKTANWEIFMKLGAGSADLDFQDYKVRTFRFDGGAAALDIKLGELLPITDVIVKSGVADVKIKVPVNSGCRIKTQTGLSAKDFAGFEKISDGLYETSNYKTSTNKIFINLDGGLSNFEVSRY
ncbi:LiaI-LiaF-like domain-containing protein [Pedobacter psychrotolerans]|uniref:LiaF transmembrane domain-containing protein n=1 Tax=Pedobacter psychrotolerans TaxID=1843235 RepID=UPI003F949961